MKVPWFILWFCVAAALSTYQPRLRGTWSTLTVLGRVGLTGKTLRRVGITPLVQGVTL